MANHARQDNCQATKNKAKGRILTGIRVSIVVVFTLITIQWVSVSSEWDTIIKSPAFPLEQLSAFRWQQTVEAVRIHESEAYVEKLMGQPQIIEARQTGEIGRPEKRVIEYEWAAYFNKYFSMYCVYVNDSLKGYLVISNDERFAPSNHRGGFSCMSNTIAEAADKCDTLKMYNMYIAANCSTRIDNNDYYIELKEQHPYGGGDFVLIGYGVCDIGLWNSNQNVYGLLSQDRHAYTRLIDEEILANNDAVTSSTGTEKVTNLVTGITHDWSLQIRNQRVNSFLVFDDSDRAGFEFLRHSLMVKTYLGTNRDKYSSFVSDYPYGYRPAS